MFKSKRIVCLILLFFVNFLKAEFSDEVSEVDVMKIADAQPCKWNGFMYCINGEISKFGKDFNSGFNNNESPFMSFFLQNYTGPDNRILPSNWFSKVNTTFGIVYLSIEDSDFEVIEDDAFNSPHFHATGTFFIMRLRLPRITKYMFNGLIGMHSLFLWGLPIKEIEKNSLYPIRYLDRLHIEYSAEPFSLQNLTGAAPLKLKSLNILSSKFGNYIDGNSFAGVANLRFLNLAGAGITAIDETTLDHFNGHLDSVWLWGNNLTTISRRTFLFLLNNNAKVLLTNNPWVCDCNLLDLKNVMKTLPNNFDVPLCDSPEEFKGKPIVDSDFCNDSQ